MFINFNGYNIPIVTLEEAISLNTATVVGTSADFAVLLAAARSAGIIRVKGVINSVYMDGAMIASPYQDGDGVELHTISMANSQSPYVIFAQLVLDGTDAKITVKITSLS